MAIAFCFFVFFYTSPMASASRSVVYSLLTVVFVLLLGLLALVWVAYNRHQRLVDATLDLQRNLGQQQRQITALQKQLRDCDTLKAAPSPPLTDTFWNSPAADSSVRISKRGRADQW